MLASQWISTATKQVQPMDLDTDKSNFGLVVDDHACAGGEFTPAPCPKRHPAYSPRLDDLRAPARG